jgi:hypothetical protein
VALRGKGPEQVWILAFGRVDVVPDGTDHAQLRILGERLDQAVDALVGCQTSDEEDTATPNVPVGPEASRIGASVHNPRSQGRRGELARRIGRYGEEAVE